MGFPLTLERTMHLIGKSLWDVEISMSLRVSQHPNGVNPNPSRSPAKVVTMISSVHTAVMTLLLVLKYRRPWKKSLVLTMTSLRNPNRLSAHQQNVLTGT